jgi:hypothetical protein
MRGVDGEAERGVAVRHRALDMIVDPGLIAAHVELVEPQRVGRRCCQLLQPGIADRAKHMRGPELIDRAHDRFGAGGMKTLQRADRREHRRQAKFASELND